VSFCSDGQPLVGPVPGAPPGLWVFAGFSAAFGLVPRLAPELARGVQSALRLRAA
jgi:glycine/D-amino acid oxidase-like deaminating enzyme